MSTSGIVPFDGDIEAYFGIQRDAKKHFLKVSITADDDVDDEIQDWNLMHPHTCLVRDGGLTKCEFGLLLNKKLSEISVAVDEVYEMDIVYGDIVLRPHSTGENDVSMEIPGESGDSVERAIKYMGIDGRDPIEHLVLRMTSINDEGEEVELVYALCPEMCEVKGSRCETMWGAYMALGESAHALPEGQVCAVRPLITFEDGEPKATIAIAAYNKS